MKKTLVIKNLIDFIDFTELSQEEKKKYDTLLISSDIKVQEVLRFDGKVIINDREIVDLEGIECKKLVVWGILWAENIRVEEVEIQGKLYANEMRTNSLVIYSGSSFFTEVLEAKEAKIENGFCAEFFKSSFQR